MVKRSFLPGKRHVCILAHTEPLGTALEVDGQKPHACGFSQSLHPRQLTATLIPRGLTSVSLTPL